MPASKELRLSLVTYLTEINKPLVNAEGLDEDFQTDIQDQVRESLIEEYGYADEDDV